MRKQIMNIGLNVSWVGWSMIVLLQIFGCKKSEPHTTFQELEAINKPAHPLFSLLPSAQTHVDFQNTLTEGLNTNILMYEYFYNGGGIATGDFNQDGLIDLYFTANMASNKMYLNKGRMQFEDITLISGAEGRPGPWKTGVTAVDINGDHLLDLYVCYSGSLPDEKRMNQLFINQGNNERGIPKFKDMAAEYGLNSPAFSTQSYFFDFDKDGDLDMILLNHNPKNLPLLNEQSTAELLKKDDPLRGTRLFRNDAGRFNDITQAAGLNGSTLSYGLGVGIADLNDDGWPDFYVSNDYSVPDYLYINNRNGTFTNQLSSSIGHTSQFSMGNDIVDVNNDTYPDIYTLDMLPEDNHRQKLLLSPDNYAKFDLNVRSGFYYQYMRNMLHLNNHNGTFSEIGQLAGISNTDWSWSALFADYDNDGDKDLYVTNGYRRDYTNLDFINYMDSYVKEKGRLVREDVMGIIDHMPASNVSNYMFSNETGLTFKNTTEAWGLKRPSNSNGAVYADLDKDGDLDLIVNNINEPAFIYENESNGNNNHYLNIELIGLGKNAHGIGSKIILHANHTAQMLEQYPTRGYQSSVSDVLHFGLGNATSVDTLIVTWPGGTQQLVQGIKADQTITLEESKGIKTPIVSKVSSPVFTKVASPVSLNVGSTSTNDFDRQPLLIHQLSYHSPVIIQGDLNKDGLDDMLFAGTSVTPPSIHIQQKNKSFIKSSQAAFDDSNLREAGAAAIFDADGDGYNDIYIASGGYDAFTPGDSLLNDRLFINDQHGSFKPLMGALPPMPASKGCVTPIDINQDGHLDLFIGSTCIPGRFPETPTSYFLMNTGKGRFITQTNEVAPDLQHPGMISDALSLDINGDNFNDLIIAGQWMPVSIFINEKGKLVNKTSAYFEKQFNGCWNTIRSADFNKDGHPDFVIGNMGLNNQIKANDQEPAELYYKDFDKNGSLDPILCTYIQGKSYPYITRDELVKQLSMFRQRFPSFESYSNVTIQDLFNPGDLKDAGHLMVNHLETSCFISDSSGKYHLVDLPVQAQYAPVHTINVMDYNHDGNVDMVLCGNEHHFKIRIGQADANYGVLLKGYGNGRFEYTDQAHSGLNVHGDVRSTIYINNILLLGINNQPTAAYNMK
jgi:hypothetical protein